MRAAKVQASLRIRAVSPEPSLLAHTSSESRGTFKQKARPLAPLNGWACAVKIGHDGIFEDTNSLDGAHILRNNKLKLERVWYFAGIFRRLSVLFERAEVRQSRRGGWLFPDDIEYSINIHGLGVRRFRARRANGANKTPLVMRMRNAAGLLRKVAKKQVKLYL